MVSCTVVIPPKKLMPEKTQLQIREFQTRQFETDDENLVMKAVINVLQDDGFILKNAVVDLGIITATKELDLARSSHSKSEDFWANFFDSVHDSPKTSNQQSYKKFKVVESSVNVTQYGKRTKVRANFQAKIIDNNGKALEVYAVDDPKFYQEFFAKVDKGIFLQKQGL